MENFKMEKFIQQALITDGKVIIHEANGVYFAVRDGNSDIARDYVVVNEDKLILSRGKTKILSLAPQNPFIDKNNLFIYEPECHLLHFRVKNGSIRKVNTLFCNPYLKQISNLDILYKGYVLVNENQIYNYKTGTFREEEFDWIAGGSSNTSWQGFEVLIGSDQIAKLIAEYAEKNKIPIGVKRIKPTDYDFEGMYKEYLTFVQLDRYGRVNSDIIYVDEDEIKVYPLENLSYNEGINYLQHDLDGKIAMSKRNTTHFEYNLKQAFETAKVLGKKRKS